jgi:hypothetical protein
LQHKCQVQPVATELQPCSTQQNTSCNSYVIRKLVTDKITVVTRSQPKNTSCSLRGTVKISVSPCAQLKNILLVTSCAQLQKYQCTTSKIPVLDHVQLKKYELQPLCYSRNTSCNMCATEKILVVAYAQLRKYDLQLMRNSLNTSYNPYATQKIHYKSTTYNRT